MAGLWVSAFTAAGTLFGVWIAYRWPGGPVLAYWVSLAVALGTAVSLFPLSGGIQRRLRWLVSIYAVLIGASLITTQIAARRAISSTHLVYRGVHLVGTDSFTIGSDGSGADVRLERASSVHIPWSLRVQRTVAGWKLDPLSGIEQLRRDQLSTISQSLARHSSDQATKSISLVLRMPPSIGCVLYPAASRWSPERSSDSLRAMTDSVLGTSVVLFVGRR